VTISLIVAAAENGVIGRGGQLPWRMPSDLKTFRRLTMGRPVVMGRKTFQSIGKPLDGRANIVVSRDPAFAAEGAIAVSSLEAALAVARATPEAAATAEIMIIGGAELYRAALPLADRIYLTRVHARPAGDAIFEVPDGWRVTSETGIPKGPKDDHEATLQVLERQLPKS
jgi:dihydrofolate reductase